MLSFRSLLLHHGYSFLFFYILAVEIGLPIPADPVLLIMGAMAGNHRYVLMFAIVTALTGALLGDFIWYGLGRFRGRSILKILCRLSLEPDGCIGKTEAMYTKRGAGALLFVKFIPGMNVVSMSLAGATRMPLWRFVLADAAGCLLWATTYLAIGDLLHSQIDSVISRLGLFGRRAGLTIFALLALYIAWRAFQRWRFRRELRINRITPEGVIALVEKGKPITIVDLRSRSDVEQEGLKIAGALAIRPEDLRSRSHEIPENQDIILYCS